MEDIRLSKFLARSGIASRRKCEEIIFAKRVQVNGILVTSPQTKVTSADDIRVDNNPLKLEEKKVYYLFNKPKGVISSHLTKGKTIYDFFPAASRLFSAGRLDKDSSGLMIITNDGTFANKVSHPSFNHTKEYLVKTSEEIEGHHLITLSKGVFIEGTLVKPKAVKKIRKGTLKITLQEGKKHEIRLLIKKADLYLLDLKRIRIGPLHLGSLLEGSFRQMSNKEKALFQFS